MTPRSLAHPSRRTLTAFSTLAAGIAVAWVDSRPRWDDTGITVLSLALVAGAGTAFGLRPWLSALLASLPVVIAEFTGESGVLVAVVIALAAAYGTALIRRMVREA